MVRGSGGRVCCDAVMRREQLEAACSIHCAAAGQHGSYGRGRADTHTGHALTLCEPRYGSHFNGLPLFIIRSSERSVQIMRSGLCRRLAYNRGSRHRLVLCVAVRQASGVVVHVVVARRRCQRLQQQTGMSAQPHHRHTTTSITTPPSSPAACYSGKTASYPWKTSTSGARRRH